MCVYVCVCVNMLMCVYVCLCEHVDVCVCVCVCVVVDTTISREFLLIIHWQLSTVSLALCYSPLSGLECFTVLFSLSLPPSLPPSTPLASVVHGSGCNSRWSMCLIGLLCGDCFYFFIEAAPSGNID